MSMGARGWEHGRSAKPASGYDIRYGRGILRSASSSWPRYLVVSSPSAYWAARKHLAQNPAGIAYPEGGDFGHLQKISDSLPGDAELVIGLGGGSALDASKYVALDKGLPLILAPSVVSTGAIIHGQFDRREGRKLVGGGDGSPWVDCEYVIVDFDLVLEAPYYLNTAGIGDVLCGYAGLAEWRRNSKLGMGPPWDEKIVAPAIEHHAAIVREFPKTLNSQGNLTDDSVRFITTALQDRDTKMVRHAAAPSGDHVFMAALELVNDKAWIHGETAALGAIIVAWYCGESPETLTSRLDTCKVRRRPSQMGISREHLQIGLEASPGYFAERDYDSILRGDPITGAKFDALWEFLETS